MKSPPTDDCDDIFGPPRTHATGYCPPKNRLSMISPKYRQKEERRKVLKISVAKLKKIEDPEVSLCRSVLINNTVKRLQKEARDEKVQKQQLNYPRCYDNDGCFLNLKSEFIKNELKGEEHHQHQHDGGIDKKLIDSLNADFAIESDDFVGKIGGDEISALTSDSVKNMEVLNGLMEENLNSLGVVVVAAATDPPPGATAPSELSRKRTYDEMEDCDVQDVLSQFYMPPTPRMLTCIDDDEDVNVVDDEPPACKRSKVEERPFELPVPFSDLKRPEEYRESTAASAIFQPLDAAKKQPDDFRMTTFMTSITEADSQLRFLAAATPTLDAAVDTTNNAFSCGHASMFNDLQSNVFHSLIASLET